MEEDPITNDNEQFSSALKQEAHKQLNPITTFFTIIIGQLIALVSVGVGQTSSIIQSHIKIPFCLNICYYLLLGIVWMSINRIFEMTPIQMPKLYFFLIIILDTQANCCKIFAFAKGQLNYPFIINSCTILFSCLFTWLILGNKYKYKFVHFIGMFLSFTGTIITFYGALTKNGDNIWNELKDNTHSFIFAFISSICFSLSTTLMDKYFEKGKDIYEFLPWLGIFGALFLSIEGYCLGDVYDLINMLKTGSLDFELVSFLNFLGFLIMFCVFGTFMPFMIMRTSNFLFNLSLVSQIFWSYICDNIYKKSDFKNYWYYIGFAIILAGIIVFSLKDIENKDYKKIDRNKHMTGYNNGSVVNRTESVGIYRKVGEEGLIPDEVLIRKKISVYQMRNNMD